MYGYVCSLANRLSLENPLNHWQGHLFQHIYVIFQNNTFESKSFSFFPLRWDMKVSWMVLFQSSNTMIFVQRLVSSNCIKGYDPWRWFISWPFYPRSLRWSRLQPHQLLVLPTYFAILRWKHITTVRSLKLGCNLKELSCAKIIVQNSALKLIIRDLLS